MKQIALFLATLLYAQFNLFAQNILNPHVEQQYRSDFGTMEIIGVSITEDATYVMIEDITPRHVSGLWISFSSTTTLTYLNKSSRILSWGLLSDDDFQEKELDYQYSLTADRRYHFMLIFPPIPSYADVISIRENVRDGFYWSNIHLNKGNAQREQRDIEEYFHPTGSGTCFAINNEGYVATCYHVVNGARQFRIRGIGNDFNKLYKARLISIDKINDLAILKIEDKSFNGFSNIPYQISGRTADVGEEIFVLGYPLRPIMGDEIKLTDGLVSSLSGYQGDNTTYQVSATVQMGNSGGPLFNKDGDVIGVVNARLDVESASYAVKGAYLKELSSNCGVSLNTTNTIKNLSLAEQIKRLKQFVFVIEVE